MASIWKGNISFGLVNIPVSLHSAAASENEISFKQLDGRDYAAIRYRKVNESTGKEVESEDIVKGYEYQKGNYVIITPDDFDKAAEAIGDKSIRLEGFIPAGSIDSRYYEKPYWLLPDKGAGKGYALLREVMMRREVVGICRITLRSREYLATVSVRDEGLLLTQLRYAAELKSIPAEIEHSAPSAAELHLAEQLVAQMNIPWDPSQYTDRYTEALKEIIECKIHANEIIEEKVQLRDGRTKARQVAQAGNVMELLMASMEVKKGRKRA